MPEVLIGLLELYHLFFMKYFFSFRRRLFYRSIPFDPVVRVNIQPQTVEQNQSQPGENGTATTPYSDATSYTYTQAPPAAPESCTSYTSTAAPAPKSCDSYTYVTPVVLSRNRTITTGTVGSGYTCVSDLPDS